MEIIGGSGCKTTSRQFSMSQIPLDAMCVSDQKLDQVTRPFTCNESVQEINTEANYFIAVGVYSGYWKEVSEDEVCKKLAFFTPEGKRR